MLAVADVASCSPLSDPALDYPNTAHTTAHAKAAGFPVQGKKKKRRRKKTQYLTDSRARVRFRFNVRLHVDGGLWERVAGEELGLVRKGVGLAGVPDGSRPFGTYKPADVTHCYLQAG